MLGALFAKTEEEFREALGDIEVLRAMLCHWRDEHKVRLKLLETILQEFA